jgi:hypothetical protein
VRGRPPDYDVAKSDRLLCCSPGQHAIHRAEGQERVFVADGIEGGMVSGNGSRKVFIVDFNSPAKGEEDSPRVAVL